jgi:hypothetical protein
MNHSKLLSLVTVLALAAPAFAQGEIDLKVTTKKGATAWLQQETKQSQVIDMQGQEMETEQSTTRILQLTIKDIDDKGMLVVETKIARVFGSMGLPMGMGDMEFDSATPEAEADEEDDGMGMGAMMGGLKKAMLAGAGKSFTAKVDSKGKVVELMDDAKAMLKDEGGGGGRMMGGPSMTEGALKNMVEEAFGEVPEKPVAVGGKWEKKDKESTGRMPTQNKMELTLAKADAESFEISVAGTVEKPASEPAKDGEKLEGDDEQAAMQEEMMKSMQVKNGKVAGMCRVSRTDGFVMEASTTVSMDVEMSAGPMGDMAMSIKMTQSMKRTTADAAAPKKAEPKKDEAKPAAPTTGGGDKK